MNNTTLENETMKTSAQTTEISHYTTSGSVRGTCGHKHRTPETAAKCCEEDRRGCKRQGGYSDRQVIEVRNGRYDRVVHYHIDDGKIIVEDDWRDLLASVSADEWDEIDRVADGL